MKKHGEVVEIDWTEKGTEIDMDVIAEELQLYTLEPEDSEDPKFEDWTKKIEDDWTNQRVFLSDLEKQMAQFTMHQPLDCPEVLFSQEDAEFYQRLISHHPAFKYVPGWAPELGHRTLFKF